MKSIGLTGFALLFSLASTATAQEGNSLGRMWTFEDPPLAYLERVHGFRPDEQWLDSLRLGSLRLGGEDVLSGFSSASFVSPQGLILTSTHCVRSAIAWTRPRDLNLIKDGFYAAEQEHEIRLRTFRDGWLTAAQLVRSSNVTDEVQHGVLPTDDDMQIQVKREANKERILDAARKSDPKLVPQIVSLYQGAVVRLYQYRVYDDLRLVVLPHVQTAQFGGDSDNFTYPRYSLDFAFLRAYEDGKPANTTQHYFRWNPEGAEEGELVFVSGNPGTTKRLLTKAQLELERDIRIPMEIERLTNALRIMKDPRSNTYSGVFDPENPSEHWAWVRTGILELENDLKAARGKLRGLRAALWIAQKGAAEQSFKSRVIADENLAKKHGDLWNRVASLVQQQRRHEPRAQFHTGAGLLDLAVAIVRTCDPTETEEHRERAEKRLRDWKGSGFNLNFHGTAHVLDQLVRARTWLPDDDPLFTKVLGGRTPKEFADLMERRTPTSLRDSAQRDTLVQSGWTAIQESDDPVVVGARELTTLLRRNENLEIELNAKKEALGLEIARAWFACYGTGRSNQETPADGTKTLRFSDGVVKGYTAGDKVLPHRTTFRGLYARSAKFDNDYPFKLPEIWLDREHKIDTTKAVNFVSTNDITSSSAGSVVVDKALRVVGVVVDGNAESLHNDFTFRDDLPRAVSVHASAILEALVKIYDARRVTDELTGI